jgi:undecaprenyl-diphosphatase
LGAVALCLLLLFGWLSFAVMAQQTLAWDERVMRAIGPLRSAPLTWWMKIISAMGSGAVEIPIALVVIWWLFSSGRGLAAYSYAAAALSSWALYGLTKFVVQRSRPKVIPHLSHDAGWYSYPSGHAMLAPLVFVVGAILWTRKWPRTEARAAVVLMAIGLSLAIAFSRVYLGAHYPTDVMGGLLLGTALSLGWMLRL